MMRSISEDDGSTFIEENSDGGPKIRLFLPVASVPREIIDVNLGIYREVKDHLPFVPLLQLILKHFKLFQNITPDFTLKRQESGA